MKKPIFNNHIVIMSTLGKTTWFLCGCMIFFVNDFHIFCPNWTPDGFKKTPLEDPEKKWTKPLDFRLGVVSLNKNVFSCNNSYIRLDKAVSVRFRSFPFAFAEKAQVFSTRKRSWSFAALHLPKGEEGATGFCKGKSGRKHEMVTCPSVTTLLCFLIFEDIPQDGFRMSSVFR